MQRPTDSSIEIPQVRWRICIPSYMSRSALRIQRCRNKQSIWVDLTDSSKEWVDFADSLDIRLGTLARTHREFEIEVTCMHEIHAGHETIALEGIEVINAGFIQAR